MTFPGELAPLLMLPNALLGKSGSEFCWTQFIPFQSQVTECASFLVSLTSKRRPRTARAAIAVLVVPEDTDWASTSFLPLGSLAVRLREAPRAQLTSCSRVRGRLGPLSLPSRLLRAPAMSSLSQELFQELGQCRFGWSLSQWIYSRWLEGFPYGMTKASLKDEGEYPLRRGSSAVGRAGQGGPSNDR